MDSDKNLLLKTIRVISKNSSTTDFNDNSIVTKGGVAIKGDLTVLGNINLPELGKIDDLREEIKSLEKRLECSRTIPEPKCFPEPKYFPDTARLDEIEKEIKILKTRKLPEYCPAPAKPKHIPEPCPELSKHTANLIYKKVISKLEKKYKLTRSDCLDETPKYIDLNKDACLDLVQKKHNYHLVDLKDDNLMLKIKDKNILTLTPEFTSIENDLIIGNNFVTIYPDSKSVYIDGNLHFKNLKQSFGNEDNYVKEIYANELFIDNLAVNDKTYFDGPIISRSDDKVILYIDDKIGFGTDNPEYPIDCRESFKFREKLSYSFEKIKASKDQISLNKVITSIIIDTKSELTLKKGLVEGQLKIINIIESRKSLILKIENFIFNHDITFNKKGQSLELLWCDNNWMVKSKYNL